jgi:hypothetical protein
MKEKTDIIKPVYSFLQWDIEGVDTLAKLGTPIRKEVKLIQKRN